MASMPFESAPAALAMTEEADAGVASSAATGACELVLLTVIFLTIRNAKNNSVHKACKIQMYQFKQFLINFFF